MIEVKCIDRWRDKSGAIQAYKLADKQGVVKILSSGELKEMMCRGLISVVNLTLTSDGRLIEKQIKPQSKPQSKKTEVRSDGFRPVDDLDRAIEAECRRIVGAAPASRGVSVDSNSVVNIDTSSLIGKVKTDVKAKGGNGKVVKDDKDYQVVSVTYPEGNKEILVIIKDSATKVPPLTADIFKNQTVRLIGGKNLESTADMLRSCGASCIDVTLLNTSNVTDMTGMFYTDFMKKPATRVIIGIENLDTSKVTSMERMFEDCKIKTLDLSNFDTSNVTTMAAMFINCEAETINLSSFDTSNVTDMQGMFSCCETKTLDLSNFDTSNVSDMSAMFNRCKVKTINLSSFDTSNVDDMSNMFFDCQAKVIAKDKKILQHIGGEAFECKTFAELSKAEQDAITTKLRDLGVVPFEHTIATASCNAVKADLINEIESLSSDFETVLGADFKKRFQNSLDIAPECYYGAVIRQNLDDAFGKPQFHTNTGIVTLEGPVDRDWDCDEGVFSFAATIDGHKIWFGIDDLDDPDVILHKPQATWDISDEAYKKLENKLSFLDASAEVKYQILLYMWYFFICTAYIFVCDNEYYHGFNPAPKLLHKVLEAEKYDFKCYADRIEVFDVVVYKR